MTTVVLALQDVAAVPGPELVPPIGRTLGALAVVLALLVALVWLFKRGMLARPKASGLSVETALPLGDRRSLVVVTVEGRRLLLGLGPGHVSLVTELEKPPASPAQALTPGSPEPAMTPPSFEHAMTRATLEGAATRPAGGGVA